jgi:hypothetical protein
MLDKKYTSQTMIFQRIYLDIVVQANTTDKTITISSSYYKKQNKKYSILLVQSSLQ